MGHRPSVAEQSIEPKLNLPYRYARKQLGVPTNYYARLIWSFGVCEIEVTSNQEIAAMCRPHWTAVWTRILREWLEWDPSRIESWFECWEEQLSARDELSVPWLYHDPVLRKIAPLFVPDSIRHRLKRQNTDPNEANDFLALLRRIERCVAWAPDYTYCDAPTYDWAAATVRLNEVLSEFDLLLPEPSYVTEFERSIRKKATRSD